LYVNKHNDNLSGFLYFLTKWVIKRKPKLKVEQELEKDEKIYLNTEEIIKLFNWRKFDYEPKKEKELLENKHIRIIEQSSERTNSKKFGGVLTVTNWELIKYKFLFQNCIGCKIGYIPHFKASNTNFDEKSQLLSWTQQKTDKRVQVPLNDMGGFIFKKFSGGKYRSQNLFPSVSQSKFNKQLKNLCEESGFLNRLVSNPKRVGSEVINTKEKPLWELILSHGGRRGFVKNSIDLGKMDYRTIMSLSGHKTFSEFSKYISVTSEDVLKTQEQGWILRNTIIWSKTNPKPLSSKSNLTPSYEFIFHLVKSMEYDYYPTLTKLSDKTKPSLTPRYRSVNGDYSKSITPYLPNIKGKNMGDYWNEDIVRTSVANQKLNIEGEHPAPFPEEIITLPILQTSKEFEVILDPFMVVELLGGFVIF
jgi:hypothetical protein